jgi:hypothetical protein
VQHLQNPPPPAPDKQLLQLLNNPKSEHLCAQVGVGVD